MFPAVTKLDLGWLSQVEETVSQDEADATINIPWAASRTSLIATINISSQQPEPDFIPSITSLLPLFTEESKSGARIRHSVDVIKKAVGHVNPGQTPVETFDQSLFALPKQIQWCWHNRYGEEQFIIMLDGLHIEMALWRCLGHWLR